MIFDLITKQISNGPSENRIGLPNFSPNPKPGVPHVLEQVKNPPEVLSDGDTKLNEALAPIEEPPTLDEVIKGVYVDKAAPSAESERDELKQHDSPARYVLNRLQPRHREIMRRVIEGASYPDIAAAMGMATTSIKIICGTSIFKGELLKLENERDAGVIQRAEDLSNEALDKLKTLMRSARTEVLQQSSAKEILGIAGYSKIEKKQVAVVSGEEVIRELNRKRRESIISSISSGGVTGPSDRANAFIEAEVTD